MWPESICPVAISPYLEFWEASWVFFKLYREKVENETGQMISRKWYKYILHVVSVVTHPLHNLLLIYMKEMIPLFRWKWPVKKENPEQHYALRG